MMLYADLLDEGVLRAYVSRFNGRARALGHGDLSVAVVRDRILESGGRCEWCGCNLVGRAFELDHIVSLREGGEHEGLNLVVACPDCNRRKGMKSPVRFALEIVAEVGYKTALVARILDAYGAEGRVQKSLFDE